MKAGKEIVVSQYRITRRGFLAAAGVVLVGRVSLASDETAASTRWALVADTHVTATDTTGNPPSNHHYFDPLGNTERIMAAIAADPGAGVIIGGDLARTNGQPGDYRSLADRVALLPKNCPVFMALGNHDHRENFRSVFKKVPGMLVPVEDKHITVIDSPPVRFIVLDSLRKVNESGGELGPLQLAWLKDFLVAGGPPTLIALHHTLGASGGITDVEAFFSAISPARCVKGVIYGHSHVHRYGARDGIQLINVPAAGYSFDELIAIGWIDAALTAVGGRFRMNTTAGPVPRNAVQELTWRA